MAVKSILQVAVKSKTENTGIIKRLLHAAIGGYEKPRSKKNIHASELTKDDPGFCPRKFRLLDLYDVKDPSQHIDVSLETTFAEGKAKQALFNNVWLRSRMVGDWKCTSCKKVVPFSKEPAGCNKPDMACNFVYDEVRVEDPISGLSGGLDALVIVKEGEKFRLVEFKIMDKDMFKKLAGPLAEHKVRTQLYLRTIAREKAKWAKQINTEEASVVYMMRGFGMKDENGDMSPFKEYTVKRDTKGVEIYSAMAHALTLSRRDPEKGFPCGVCKTMMSDQAHGCPVRKQCFGPHHPPTITWAVNGKPAHTYPTIESITNGTTVEAPSES